MLNGLHAQSTLVFAGIIQLLYVGVYIFSEGFLLKRDVLEHKSSNLDFQPLHLRNEVDGAWMAKRFDKLFLVIVDALRYDFAVYNDSVPFSTKKHYENNLGSIRFLQEKYSDHSALFKFVADPPTTTMQRLKGLTTGSLPTFIDVGHNFASEEILEDNLIDQLKNYYKRIVMLGDDTWGNLFPNRFTSSHLFPSFNVMDLDTVDDGILELLPAVLDSNDWDILILHFLGVDHCGHRYGPSHPEMTRKLSQMDNVIRTLSEKTDNSTILVVMGDHGMTPSGDHGGDSKEELEAALFLYSPGLEVRHSLRKVPTVTQVDIVPTLSLLLGVPIPFSNLGSVIEEVFGSSKTERSLDDALYLNYKQVNRYLKVYHEEKEGFPSDKWTDLDILGSQISGSASTDSKVSTVDKRQLIFRYLNLARMMCEEIWAQFNMVDMIIGLVILFSFILLIVVLCIAGDGFIVRRDFIKVFIVVWVSLNLFLIGIIVLKLEFLKFLMLVVVFCAFFYVKFDSSVRDRSLLGKDVILYAIPFMFLCLGSFSNSFVVVENYICPFLIVSLSLLLSYSFFSIKISSSTKYSKIFGVSQSSVVFLSSLCCLCLCLRVSVFFWKCREEQYWCDTTTLVHHSIDALPKLHQNRRYFTSVIPVVCFVFLYRYWMKSCGNFNSADFSTIISKYSSILLTGALISYWALKSQTGIQNSPINAEGITVLLAQSIYLITMLSNIFIWFNPIFVYTLPNSTSLPENDLIPKLFMKLRNSIENSIKGNTSQGNGPPVVYGLATCVSAPFLAVLVLFYFVFTLLGGDGHAPSVFLLFVSMIFYLVLHACFVWRTQRSVNDLLKPKFASICLWFLLCQHFFYALGHQPTFATINWQAAFVGYVGEGGGNVIPAILVVLNTFSSHFIFGFSLPLLVLFPLGLGFVCPRIRQGLKEGELERGEYILVEKPVQAVTIFIKTSAIYVALHATKVLFVALAGLFLRRHLMVWKIFAPHFIFESLALLVTIISVICGLTFVFRVIGTVENWTKKIS